MGFGARWNPDKVAQLQAAKAPAPATSAKKPRAPAKPKPLLSDEETERQLQTKCHQAFKRYAPTLNWVLPDGTEAGLGWMNKNDGKKNIVAASLDKAQGLTPGVPDWQLAVASKGFYSLFVEFKTLTGTLSDAQKEMHAQLTSQGHLVKVVRTLAEFCRLLYWYLGPARFRLKM